MEKVLLQPHRDNLKLINLFILIIVLASFKCSEKRNIEKYVNTHWYSKDIFDVHIKSKNEINFLYTPSCLIAFKIKNYNREYKIYFNGLIDCNLHPCFFDKKLNRTEPFATMSLINDTTIQLKYHNLEYINQIKKIFKQENFFPKYLKIKDKLP